jgi:MurNAc alpha-1-phosphate uridylyltransferase
MRDHPSSVMMFAAGFGTRMGDLTRAMPKPLIEVAGRPLIDHALELAREVLPECIVVNLHYLPEQLEAHLEGQDVLLSNEQPDILETGGGLRHALPLLGDGPVFTSNTDAIWKGPNPFSLLKDAWDPSRMSALLLCIPKAHAEGHNGEGDFLIDPDGQARRGPGLIYSGVQIIKPDLLAAIPDQSFSLNLLWDQMLQDGTLYALPYPGRWCDVGRPEGIATAEAMLKDV